MDSASARRAPQELIPSERRKFEYASPTVSSGPWRWTPPGVEVVCKVSFLKLSSLSSVFVVIAEYAMYAPRASTTGMARRVDARRR